MVTDCPSCNSKSLFWLDNDSKVLSCNKCKSLFDTEGNLYDSIDSIPFGINYTIWGQICHVIDLQWLYDYDQVSKDLGTRLAGLMGRELMYHLEMYDEYKKHPYEYHLEENYLMFEMARQLNGTENDR